LAGLAATTTIRDGAGAVRTGVRATGGFFAAFTPRDRDADFFVAVTDADGLTLVGFFGVDFATGIPHFSRTAAAKPRCLDGKGRFRNRGRIDPRRALRRWKPAARVESGTTLSIKCVTVNTNGDRFKGFDS
jgi:hypothetical protein